MKAQPLYATAIGLFNEEDHKIYSRVPADKVIDYSDHEKLCNLVQEYLKYSSIDGRAERIELRKQLDELTK